MNLVGGFVQLPPVTLARRCTEAFGTRLSHKRMYGGRWPEPGIGSESAPWSSTTGRSPAMPSYKSPDDQSSFVVPHASASKRAARTAESRQWPDPPLEVPSSDGISQGLTEASGATPLGGQSRAESRPSFLQQVIEHAIVVVRFCTLGMTIVVWSVVGFVFWVPLLARNTLAFTTHTLYANLRHGNATVTSLGLEHAITFYVNGFQNIIHAVLAPNRHAGPYSGPPFKLMRMIGDSLIAAIFWWIILFSFAQFGLVGEELGRALKRPIVVASETAVRWWDEATTAFGWTRSGTPAPIADGARVLDTAGQ
jgi:hypothetical protein